MKRRRLPVEERLKIGEEAYHSEVPYIMIAEKYNVTEKSVITYAFLYRQINNLPAARKGTNQHSRTIKRGMKEETSGYIPPKSNTILEYVNEYEPLTKAQQMYLLEAPNNYYFRKIDRAKEEAIERLAKDNGFYVQYTKTYPVVGTYIKQKGDTKKPKSDGYIVHFERIKNDL